MMRDEKMRKQGAEGEMNNDSLLSGKTFYI